MKIYKEYIIPLKSKLNILSKELTTNLISLGLVVGSFFISQTFSNHLFYIGLFALSGSLTNQIAIHMLFNRVPLLYGSGIIELKFEDLKLSIRRVILEEFLSTDRIKTQKINITPTIEKLDFSTSFDALLDSIVESKFAAMISLIGGVQALEALREPFTKRLKSSLIKLSDKVEFQVGDSFSNNIDSIVQERLNELTPNMVKQMLLDIMREYLGWLVVWGGVFGGLIGFISSLVL
jgi:uncharacterized membrane protein YheB (UPF0754 family)